MADIAHKTCAACGQAKPRDQFHKNSRMADGIRSSCKPCVLATNRQSVLRHHDRRKQEKRDEYQRIKDTPEYKAYQKAYMAATREQKRLYDREYSRRNSAKNIERAKAWAKANPQSRSAIAHNYDARRRVQVASGLKSAELAEWKAAQPKVCYWCGCRCSRNHHVDHYVPLSKGGKHELANLVIACGPCNLKKNAKDPLDFAREVGRLL